MKKETLIGALALIVLVGGAVYLASRAPSPPGDAVSNEKDLSVRAFVEAFGARFKNVSLLADDAGAQIAREYGPYVSPELIAKWQEKPENAPGRLTSNPFPDRVEITTVLPLEDGAYFVEASIMERASGGDYAAFYPLKLTVRPQGDSWLITLVEKGALAAAPERVSLVGFWECLPHKDRTGPQTMECALGIALDQSDGHVAIDTSLMSVYPVDFAAGTKVRAEGLFTPANQLSGIQRYNIDGVLRATTITEIQ